MLVKWLSSRTARKRDGALLARMAADDASALGELYDRHAPAAFAHCIYLLKENALAQRVLVEVFEQLWKMRGKLQPPPHGLRACIAALVEFHARSHLAMAGPSAHQLDCSQTTGDVRPDSGLHDVLRTALLQDRFRPPPDFEAENSALHAIAGKLVNDSKATLDALVECALNLCGAGSAGVSLLETGAGSRPVFRWVAVAGEYAQHLGGSAPADFSPCGTTLALGSPQLFIYPERHYKYFQEARPVIIEGLVIPFRAGDVAATIWVVSHSEAKQFHAEDARVMSSLAGFAAAAITAQNSLAHAQGLAIRPIAT